MSAALFNQALSTGPSTQAVEQSSSVRLSRYDQSTAVVVPAASYSFCSYSHPLPSDRSKPLSNDEMVNHRRGPWSQHEDAWLLNLVHRNGPHNWVRISQEIGTRSPKQCRERYHQNLKPTLNHDPITPEEGEQIERLVQEMGKRWAEIARRLKGRSDNAVKNWWNGGQNRRKRNVDRHDTRGHEQLHASPTGYPYPTIARSLHHPDDESVHQPQHGLPPLVKRDFAESHYYPESRRPSLNPPVNSPHALKLPHPHHAHEPYSGPRPQPLELQSFGAFSRGRGYETPMPSPSGFSVVSADGAPPSLITDTGSESRSPRGAASPLDITLAPLVGGRNERKNSSTRYLPQSGFPVDDDDHSMHYDHYKRRASVQLPPLHRPEPKSTTPTFREPNYRPEKPQLLTQPAPQHYHHHHSMPHSATLPTGQQSLPAFHTLGEPGRVPQVQSATSPASVQLPSPFARPAQPAQSKSAPSSPQAENRDKRMNVMSMLT